LFSSSKDIFPRMENELYCLVHWRPPLVRALSQMNPVKANIAYRNHFGAFVELRKATIRFIMSICPSVHVEKLGCHWRDSHEFWYL